ncbi:MAG TPA: pyridine nucleotide-disulfide oxidoreductase [Proteiniclasticum sp.]|uniref:NAD(P)-dependent oxidoreductase n=1 Tax=Proteiniclasticum sp. TaxID=2053595 RepID=UPI000E97D6E7|nr:NAD(P)-dependent oxidoreductase [Proteiniclasticum sp.]HBW12370.1 pyridine nucleotide-disulfide oxidoreductase [Proteiniclasticum sp.]
MENNGLYLIDVEQGYTMQEAVKEAKRCLDCKNPTCITGCPIENEIPNFIREISKGNFGEAREILARKTNLPAICGRVCPHDLQCEGHCILAKAGKSIHIGKLERFVADFDHSMGLINEKIPRKTRGKVAVIGSGPAGLTIAGDLAKGGFNVVVYEAQEEPGGILLYGIPDFRLPKDVVRREIKKIESYGVTFMNNMVAGEGFTVDDLFERGFDAVFIGTGTALSNQLDIPGKELKGVELSSYFLRTSMLANEGKLPIDEVLVKDGSRVIVIGSGNVAMDAARTAVRIGAKEVKVIYRRKEEDMPATKSEYEDALKEGVQFYFESAPIAYNGKDGVVTGLRVNTPQGELIHDADVVLVAIGSKPARRIVSTTEGIEVDSKGYVITREKPYGMTTLRGVFAGGDVVHQPATVVKAMKEAKKVADGIAAYVDAKKLLEA